MCLKNCKILETKWRPRYIDIGVNISDKMFNGIYNGNCVKHESDIEEMILRSKIFNVKKFLVTSSNISESENHIKICEKYPEIVKITMGVHPCMVSDEFFVKNQNGKGFSNTLAQNFNEKLEKLRNLVLFGVEKGFTKAFGEIGLDYDRKEFSNVYQQKLMFLKQLELYSSIKNNELPLFLHMRNACDDFIEILKPFIENGSIKGKHGVVHSFTGSEKDLKKILDLGFYIGVNGCSLRTKENLHVALLIPKEKIMIETDAPWCSIKTTHESYKLLTPYPNIFYPSLSKEEIYIYNLNFCIIKNLQFKLDNNNSTEKNLSNFATKQQKKYIIKMHNFLPFSTVGVNQYEKHKNSVNEVLNIHSLETSSSNFNMFISPIVKSRNEPVLIGQVAEILCKILNINTEIEIQNFIDTVYENTYNFFQF